MYICQQPKELCLGETEEAEQGKAEQIKNPYHFRCEKTSVQICFTEEGDDLESLLEDFFIHLKQECSTEAGGERWRGSEE